MRRGRGAWWWAQIGRGFFYLVLGIVSAGLALWVSVQLPFAYPNRVGAVVFVLVWITGVCLIEVKIESEPATEEEV